MDTLTGDVTEADIDDAEDAGVAPELEMVLPTEMVEMMVFDGALATVDGTGRVEVSLAIGDCSEPDMPVRLHGCEFLSNMSCIKTYAKNGEYWT